MDSNGCSRQRRMHFPEFKLRRSFSSAAEDSKRDGTERKGKEEPSKNVTIATTSRYLTEQRYVTRKPLFSKEERSSLLKVEMQKGEPLAVSRTEHTDVKPMTRPRESLSHVLLPSASVDDPCSLLTVPRLQARLQRDKPSSGSPFHGSSSILEVQRVNTPFRPPLTSTVLYPTYTPRTRQPRMQEESSGGQNKLGRPKEVSSGSSYQADYWACAIPKALPPAPDRHSASWNPNKEYEALLDYTYPLRPGHVDSEWDSSELHRDSLLKTDSNMQDSGIEDPLCSSASLAGLDFSDNRTEKTRDGGVLCTGYRSPDLQGFPRSIDDPPSNTSLSLAHSLGLFLDGRGDGDETSYHSRDRYNNHQHHTEPLVSTASLRSTSVLPRSTCEFGEADEDFLLLPAQLEEMQRLSRQVREVTAWLRPPVTASSDSLDQDAILSPVSLPRRQPSEEEGDIKQQNRPERVVDDRNSDTFRSSFVLGVEPEAGRRRSGVRMEVRKVEELCDLTLPEGQKNSQKLQEQSDSLMQQIQMFCSHLQQLIQQLYALSERMERLAAPSVDVDGIKSSLAEYQMFQRELIDHQPLTSCVLRAGQHLLSCINTTSPFLRDALVLIEGQCGALQTHSDLLFSSILSATDRLLQPPRSQQSPAGIQASRLSTH